MTPKPSRNEGLETKSKSAVSPAKLIQMQNQRKESIMKINNLDALAKKYS